MPARAAAVPLVAGFCIKIQETGNATPVMSVPIVSLPALAKLPPGRLVPVREQSPPAVAIQAHRAEHSATVEPILATVAAVVLARLTILKIAVAALV